MVRRMLQTIFSPWGKVVIASFTASVTLLFSLPQGTQSQLPTVKLNLLGYGSVPWSVANIAPGDSGIKAVSLYNAGSNPGKVIIWLSNIRSEEGENPRSETGNTAEPGELDNYLRLRLSAAGMVTTLSMPARLTDYPTSAESSTRIEIAELKAGEKVDLIWSWELPLSTGNDAQGDKLTFNINYMIEDKGTAAPPAPTKPPPALAEPVRSIQVVVPGLKTVEKVEVKEQIIPNSVTAKSTTKPISISLSNNSRVINPTASEIQARSELPVDEIPHEIKAIVAEEPEPIPIPEGWKLVSDIWDISGYTYSIKHHVIIDPPAAITIGYYQDLLPEYIEALSLFYWNEVNKEWVQLQAPPGYIAGEGEMAALVGHLSIFAVLAKEGTEETGGWVPPGWPATPTPPEGTPTGTAPANIIIKNLTVNPPQIYVGENSNVKATVVNEGGMAGEFTATLTLDGKPLASQTLTLRPGESHEVEFNVKPDLPGIYGIEINQLDGQLDVISLPTALDYHEPTYWWLVASAGAVVIILTLLVRVGAAPAPAKVAVGVGAGGAGAYVLMADSLKEIYIMPEKPSIGTRTSIQLKAYAKFYDGTQDDVTDKVEWSSSAPRTAEVLDNRDFKGLVFGHAPGTATITIKWHNKKDTTEIGVNASILDAPYIVEMGAARVAQALPEPKQIEVVPANPTVDIGGTVQFKATASFADGSSENITERAIWTSTNDFVADVDTHGYARAFSAGMTAIIATFRGKRGTTTLGVRRPPRRPPQL